VACEDEPRDLWLDTVDWIVMVVPPLFPIFTAAFLSLHWREIRDDKELTMDISSISYGMVLGLTCTAIQWTLRFRTRSSDWARNASESHRYRAYLGAMMACVFGVLSWRMCRLGLFGLKVPAWPGLASATIPTMRMTIASNALWIVSIWGIRWWLQSHLATESSDPMADRFWKWGYFYSNPDDPALVVPLRSGVGFSHNFARASVWWGLAIFTTSVTASLAVSLGLMR
jgi:uncharacterized membrane protein